MRASQLVSVVIPAYNASATLDETLQSVRSQTHSALEIIVVDDGSADDTRAIAARHAEVDLRLRVLTQENAGVAVARNTGWRNARSELIAFVDADDLWAPTKIARQVQRLQAGGAKVGLVYCWSARIDDRGSIIGTAEVPRYEGDVLERLLCGNFVGNGSSALVRRDALIDAGGFETGLRAAGAEGCEDFLFYNRVAERYHFALVSEHLVGYRYLDDAMSRDRTRMLRSWMMVCDEMLTRHPGLADVIERGRRNYSGWITREALGRQPWQLSSMLALLLRRHPSIAMRVVLMNVMTPLATGVGRGLRRLCRTAPNAMGVETSARFIVGTPEVFPQASDADRGPMRLREEGPGGELARDEHDRSTGAKL